MMNLPSTSPTVAPAIGPSNGISLTLRASDEPSIAAICGEASGSTDSTIEMTCTSLLYPSGNRGRIGRSIRRLVNVASSLGLPSRLLKPPGIFPAAYNFSSYATVSGKNPISLGAFDAVAVEGTTVSPYLTSTEPLACFAISPYYTDRKGTSL